MNPQITDKEGLQKAYSNDSKLYTHGNTLCVAGTSNLHDVHDDLTIPFNQTSQGLIYRDAHAVLRTNPLNKNVVGHSLGGAMTLELQNNYTVLDLTTSTYGAPVFLWFIR